MPLLEIDPSETAIPDNIPPRAGAGPAEWARWRKDAGIIKREICVSIPQSEIRVIKPLPRHKIVTKTEIPIIRLPRVRRAVKFAAAMIILHEVSYEFGVDREDVVSVSREQKYVRPRQVGMYLCRKLIRLSYPRCANIFGRCDHTTAIHAFRRVETMMDDDTDFADRVRSIKRRVVVAVAATSV